MRNYIVLLAVAAGWTVLLGIVWVTKETRADERACYTLRDQIRGEVMVEELRRAPHITVCEGGEAREWARVCKEVVCSTDVAGRPTCWSDRDKELFALCMSNTN